MYISSSVTSSQCALQVYANQFFLDSLILFDLKPSLSLLAAEMHFFSFWSRFLLIIMIKFFTREPRCKRKVGVEHDMGCNEIQNYSILEISQVGNAFIQTPLSIHAMST